MCKNWLPIFGIIAMLAWPVSAQQDGVTTGECLASQPSYVSLGFCFGFSTAYFQATGNSAMLERMATDNMTERARPHHERCYRTDFTPSQALGALALNSRLKKLDDSSAISPELLELGEQCRKILLFYGSRLDDSE